MARGEGADELGRCVVSGLVTYALRWLCRPGVMHALFAEFRWYRRLCGGLWQGEYTTLIWDYEWRAVAQHGEGVDSWFVPARHESHPLRPWSVSREVSNV